jgi:hypothetical protein
MAKIHSSMDWNYLLSELPLGIGVGVGVGAWNKNGQKSTRYTCTIPRGGGGGNTTSQYGGHCSIKINRYSPMLCPRVAETDRLI